MQTPTDAELLRRYAESHSEEAFAELVRQHLPLVFNTALRRVNGDTHRAEEIAQTVFAALALKAAKLSGHPALTGWLHTSTRYAAAALVRSEQRRQTREQEVMSMPQDSTPTIDWEQLRPVIDEALDQLDDRDRAAVLLRFFENQPLAQVGATLALSEDAVRKRVDRALETLRRLLAKRGIASTATALGLALASNIAVAAPATLATSIITAAATTASSTGLLTFLAMTKLQSGAIATLIVALAATAGSVSLGVVVSRQQAELSNARINSSAQDAADNRQLAELREKLTDDEKARDAVRADLKRLADKKAQRAREEEDALHGPSRMLQRRRATVREYHEFFEQMKMDAATREKFIAIKVEEDVADLAAILSARKTTGEDYASREVMAGIWTASDREIRDLLGSEGMEAYRAYTYSPFRRSMGLGADFADAGYEIRTEQRWKLDRIYYETIVKQWDQSIAVEPLTPGKLSSSQEAFLSRAGDLLTAEQLQIIRRSWLIESAFNR